MSGKPSDLAGEMGSAKPTNQSPDLREIPGVVSEVGGADEKYGCSTNALAEVQLGVKLVLDEHNPLVIVCDGVEEFWVSVPLLGPRHQFEHCRVLSGVLQQPVHLYCRPATWSSQPRGDHDHAPRSQAQRLIYERTQGVACQDLDMGPGSTSTGAVFSKSFVGHDENVSRIDFVVNGINGTNSVIN